MAIKKIIFGSDFKPKIKEKLEWRQAYNESSNPLSSIQTIKTKYSNGIKDVAEYGNEFGGKADLSSRTPFARMWTAVQLFYMEKDVPAEQKDESTAVTVDGNTMDLDIKYNVALNDETHKSSGLDTSVQEVDVPIETVQEKIDIEIPLEKTVYVVGNHVYNSLTNNKGINQPIIAGEDNVNKHVAGTETSTFFTKELSNNKLMKPPAGITSISSTTEGGFGPIKRTTVNFTVHNFKDYENIYSRFFLKPGAQVFIDFGWNTADLYDPNELMKDASSYFDKGQLNRGTTIDDVLYGDKGFVETSNGDLETLIGNVVSFDSKIKENGTFECSVEVLSKNNALLDYAHQTKSNSKPKFITAINTYLINLVANKYGNGFLKKNWLSSTEQLDEYNEYSNSFGQKILSGGAAATIPSDQLQLGIYWEAITEDKKSISNNNNLYISWGFFEDELLNKEFSFTTADDDPSIFSELSVEFDSSNSFIRYDKHLMTRQKTAVLDTSNAGKTKLKFLYPDDWTTTYNTLKGKIPNYSDVDKNYKEEITYVDMTSEQIKEAKIQWEYLNYEYQTIDPNRNPYRNPKKLYDGTGIVVGDCEGADGAPSGVPTADKIQQGMNDIVYYQNLLDECNDPLWDTSDENIQDCIDVNTSLLEEAKSQLPQTANPHCLGPYDLISDFKPLTFKAYKTINGLEKGREYTICTSHSDWNYHCFQIKETKNIEIGNYDHDIKLNRIPFREIFINTSIIREAFKGQDTVNDVIKYILDELNTESYGVFNLQLYDPTGHGSTFEIVDSNMSGTSSHIKDDFDKYFQFKPGSKNSIVKSMDVNFKMPQNGAQDIIAIQNSSNHIPIFPQNPDIDMNNALRMIDNTIPVGSDDNSSISLKYIPSQTDSNLITKRLDVTAATQNEFLELSPTTGDVSKNTNALSSFANKMNEIVVGREMENLRTNMYDTEIIESKDETKSEKEEINESDLYPDSLFAKDMEDYYGLLAKKDFFTENLPTDLNMEASLSIYGTAGIVPGNLFRIDYLPEKYRKNIFFQITGISHEIGTSTWTTSISSIMRIAPATKARNTQLTYKPSNIFISSNYLNKFGLPDALKGKFVGFKLVLYSYKPPKNSSTFVFEGKTKSDIKDGGWPWGGIQWLIRFTTNRPQKYSFEYKIKKDKNFYIIVDGEDVLLVDKEQVVDKTIDDILKIAYGNSKKDIDDISAGKSGSS